jgi:hypothetical protein
VGVLGLLVTAAGCVEPIRVRSVYGPGIRLDGLGSQYQWLQPSPNRAGNDQFDQFIRTAFDEQLAAKGFTLTEDPLHDFDLDYRVGRVVKGDILYERTYEEGSLIIDVLDPQDGRIIWRGIAEATIRSADPPETRQKRITDAARRLLEQFPPRLGSPEPGQA